MTLDEARENIGRAVDYQVNAIGVERGTIARVSMSAAFVQFPGREHPLATPVEKLTLAGPS